MTEPNWRELGDPMHDRLPSGRTSAAEAIQARLDKQVQSYKNLRDVATHAVTDLLMQDPSLAWNAELRELAYALDLGELAQTSMQESESYAHNHDLVEGTS